MIPLVLRCTVEAKSIDPFVCRLEEAGSRHDIDGVARELDRAGTTWLFEYNYVRFSVDVPRGMSISGDVVLVDPSASRLSRLIRAGSHHNTFLITEQCDQLCVMCSQPPKKTHEDQFDYYLAACRLAPHDAVIGLSGGEPTLHKKALFAFVESASQARPDLSFHVLTNAQHFENDDRAIINALRHVCWGVPLYAADAALHDEIVGKTGAAERLEDGLAILGLSGAQVELRTVVLQQNAGQFNRLAEWVVDRANWIDVWAIMQLEKAGYARTNWDSLFFDHSTDFSDISGAASWAMLHGVPVSFYNFPHCTLPVEWRKYAPQTISDWKNRLDEVCEGCTQKEKCCGFFEWHPRDKSYAKVGAL